MRGMPFKKRSSRASVAANDGVDRMALAACFHLTRRWERLPKEFGRLLFLNGRPVGVGFTEVSVGVFVEFVADALVVL